MAESGIKQLISFLELDKKKVSYSSKCLFDKYEAGARRFFFIFYASLI